MDQQQCQQKPFSLTHAASCVSLITDTIIPLMKNPTPPTKCTPMLTTKHFISSPSSAFPYLLFNDPAPAHQFKSLLSNNSLTSLPIECCSRFGTTGTQQPSDTTDDISPDLSSINKGLFFSSTTHPPNTTIRQNSIPYLRAYRYRTFCTTYGNPVKPGSIWHFRSWHYLLQHSTASILRHT